MENPRNAFLNDEEGHLQSLDQMLISSYFDIDLFFRKIHTIKGNAKLFGFNELAKLLHCYEMILKYLKNGNLILNDQIKNILTEGVLGLKSAFDVYLVDAEYPLVFTTKILEILKFIKQNVVQEKDLDKKPDSQISDLDLKELLKKIVSTHDYEYFLSIRVSNEVCYIPVNEVEQVVYQPEILPLMGNFLLSLQSASSVEKAKLVCFSGKVMPLLSCFALSKNHTSETGAIRELPTVPWAVIVKDSYTKLFQGTSFCIPVDDVFEVLSLDHKKDNIEKSIFSFKNLITEKENDLAPLSDSPI